MPGFGREAKSDSPSILTFSRSSNQNQLMLVLLCLPGVEPLKGFAVHFAYDVVNPCGVLLG